MNKINIVKLVIHNFILKSLQGDKNILSNFISLDSEKLAIESIVSQLAFNQLYKISNKCFIREAQTVDFKTKDNVSVRSENSLLYIYIKKWKQPVMSVQTFLLRTK